MYTREADAEEKSTLQLRVKDALREIPDWPTKGVVFRDIGGLLAAPDLFKRVIEWMATSVKSSMYDVVMSPDARGFIFGAALAYKMGKPFIPVRKAGKLPPPTVQQTYALEYGQATIEAPLRCLHSLETVGRKIRVLIVDDILATGGTVAAMRLLAERLEATCVTAIFVAELETLGGRSVLKSLCNVHCLVSL